MTDEIKLEVRSHGTGRSYLVTFATEDQALAFIDARRATHDVREAREHQVPEDCEDLYDRLYPKCEHGLLAELCAGPQHYPYDDDELRGMGVWR